MVQLDKTTDTLELDYKVSMGQHSSSQHSVRHEKKNIPVFVSNK